MIRNQFVFGPILDVQTPTSGKHKLLLLYINFGKMEQAPGVYLLTWSNHNHCIFQANITLTFNKLATIKKSHFDVGGNLSDTAQR